MLPNSNGTDENRAKFRRDSVNPMTPRSADGSIAGGARIDPNCVPAPAQPAGVLGARPLNADPHSHGRRSNNLSEKPPERPGKHFTDEIHRRLHGRDVKYR